MLTATSRRLMLVAVALAVCGAARQAQATTITFDNPITTPNAGQPNNLAGTFNQYQPPAPGGTAFNTQGYAFNGVTTGVTGGNTTPELNIVLDPSLCVANIGVACTSDGSQYLATDQPFGLFPQAPLSFSLQSFDAVQVFPPGGCPACDSGNGILNAVSVEVFGFRSGSGLVAQQTFTLSQVFQTFVLNNDPDWSNITRAVFEGLDANGAPDGAVGYDNINATALPEPASLLLLGTGIASLAARRRAKRAVRQSR